MILLTEFNGDLLPETGNKTPVIVNDEKRRVIYQHLSSIIRRWSLSVPGSDAR